MRVAALLFLLAACARVPVEVTVMNVPADSPLDLHGQPLDAHRIWELEVRSHHPERLRLDVRLKEPAPEGMIASLWGETEVGPNGSAKLRLRLSAPARLGPFSGEVVIFSPDLAEFERTIPFEGSATADGQSSGPALSIEPKKGILRLGRMRAGEERDFAFVLTSVGTAPLLLDEVAVEHATHVRVEGFRPRTLLGPGESYELRGRMKAPTDRGGFRLPLVLRTNAVPAAARELALEGEVVPPYLSDPEVVRLRMAVPEQRTEVSFDVVAGEGVPPFTIVDAQGLEPYFDAVSLGGPEPAARQPVRLRLREDAPHGLARLVLRFTVAPAGEVVDVPAVFEVRSGIFADPDRVTFGKVRADQDVSAEVRIASLGRDDFEIEGVTSEYFHVLYERPAGMSWRLEIRPIAGLPPRVYNEEIEVRTSDPRTPNLLIPVYLEIVR